MNGAEATRKRDRDLAALGAWSRNALSPAPALYVSQVPELRADAEPMVTLRLDEPARKIIHAELDFSRELIEKHGSETGGWLFAKRDAAHYNTWHLRPTRLGDGRRKPNALTLDRGEAARAVREFEACEATGYRFCGCWHIHPTGNPEPSGPDRTSAHALISGDDFDNTPFAVTLILTPNRDRTRRWSQPQMHAWTTHPAERRYSLPFTIPAGCDTELR